jgi:acyl-coenzyme A thioesterase PaaI-like protein
MGLRMWAEDDRIRGEVTLDRRQEGAPGYAHGGAVATVLDDALGSLLMLLKAPAVTAKLEINYRRPAFIGRRFELEAWVDRTEGRKLYLAGEMREDGEPIADATGLFLRVDPEHFVRGAMESEEVLTDLKERGLRLPW